ncbi:putative ABC transport system permease protein [Fontibacillus solani]|uniref:Putative ABC transport system permease protein n=1 Tax=Fontibacillus solani TaxID=1572857 RepID=A0A7W3SR58_9BACL|nr:ABC transporter permease [Fontibacillus solani]MBA9084673.1 putative ABC transport system permease protein [Fontibacillus solani]
MVRSSNGGAISRIAKRSLSANRSRNIIIVSAIVLTTLLITTIFTTVLSMNQSMQLVQMKTAGSDFHGSFKYLNPEELQKLESHPSIKDYGKSVLVGEAVNDELKDYRIEIDYSDMSTIEHSFIHFIAGGLPAAENEIVMNTWSLDLLGVPHKIGATVDLDVDIDGKILSKPFVLSGYYEADKHIAMAGMAFVSEPFVQKYISHIDPEESKQTGSYINTTRLDVMFSNSIGIEKKIQKVLSDTGLDVSYGVNWAYSSVGLFSDPINLLPYGLLVLIIMLSGYLLIYNIFHISVVRDIKFYGLLKTMGTTPRQLKKIISIQANLLYAVGMPIGLALGYGMGCWLTPMLMSFSTENSEISYSFSPLIFVGAALFSYITVRIAASRPGRTAARISPVEAVKFAGVNGGKGRKIRKSLHGAKLHRMAFANLFRQKKKLVLMLASLSLSIILFSVIYTVISSFSVNKYLNAFISGDYVVKANNGAIENIRRDEPQADVGVSEELCQAISAIDGVTSLDKVYYSGDTLPIDERLRKVLEPIAANENPEEPVTTSILKSGAVSIQLHGIDRGWYDVIQKSDIVSGSFDQEKFETGNYVLITETTLREIEDITYYEPGDQIKLGSLGKSYEVMAVLKSDALYAAGTQFFNVAGFKVFLPANEMRQHAEDAIILSATVHIDPEKEAQVGNALSSLTNSNQNLTLKSREDYKEEMKGFIRIFQTVGYGLSFIIAFIGILNYINTILTGVISRRNEFAILESVGMTRKQLKKMLIYEGLYSILFTCLIVGTVGIYITYQIARGISENMAFTVFHMNPIPILSVFPLLIGISLIVTLAAYKSLTKATIVERLREVE